MVLSPLHHPAGSRLPTRGLHLVAIFEGAKGLLVLLVGFQLLTFIHKDLHHVALRLVMHLHLNPASHYLRIFLDLTERLQDTRLWLIAAGAAMYSIVRMIKAVGLWLGKRWADWFGLVTGGMYIPLELYELVKRQTWPRITVFLVNLLVVAYLLFVVSREMSAGRQKSLR